MIYEAYEARMLKIAAVIAKIKKYRVLIISVLCVILALISAFVATKGIIISDTAPETDSFVYGSMPNMKSKALFGKVTYQFKPQSASDEAWSADLPTMPGKYQVRAVSKRSFGLLSYGDPFEITMNPRPVTVGLLNNSIVYGDSPELRADLVYGDRISEFDYTYSDSYSLTTEVEISADSLKILSESGKDVSAAYAVTYSQMTASIIPRVINVTFGSAEKTYDGTPLSTDEFTVGEGELLSGDVIKLGELVSVTDYREGGYENFPDFIFENGDGENISQFYSAYVTPGVLMINKRPIGLRSSSAAKVFDGTPLVSEEVLIVSGTLVGDHSVSAYFTQSNFLAGSYENRYVPYIVTEDLEDVTENYDINVDYGKLDIAKRKVKIRLSDMTWIYDSLVHSSTDIFPLFEDISSEKNEGMIEGYYLEIETDGSITNVGNVRYGMSGFSVFSDYGVDATESFEIEAADGSLTVIERPIVLIPPSSSFEYDGKLHESAELFYGVTYQLGYLDGTLPKLPDGQPQDMVNSTWTDFALADGHYATFTATGAGKSVGIYNYSLGSIKIFDADGNEVTSNYSAESKSAVMEIYKRSINVTTASESFVYDGLFHTISPNAENILVHTYSDIPALCENHTVKILSVVTLRFVGDVDNVPDYIKIYDELGTDVTENYEINEFYGKLSVTHRPITVTMLDGIWEYNGKIHTGASLVPYFDMEYTGDAQKSPLASGESITIESIGEIKNVGLISHTAGGITISDGTENTTFNYDINIVDGSLEVYPRKVTLASLGATKVYDAEPLTRHMYEIISGSLIDGHELFVEFSGTRTDAGNSENTFFASAVMEGLDDIIKNYEFTYQNGVLEVTQRPITLVANSKTYVYDGYYKYGVDAGYYILDPTSLLTSHGHTVEVLSDSAIIDVGTLDNAISKVIITANNLDVTKNYLVSTEIGKLTVTQREIVIITTDVSKVYDGTALESGSLDSLYMYYAPNGVIDDSTFAISPADIAFAEKCYITYVSESGMENTYRIISLKRSETNSDVIGNYIISYNFGIMSITKKDITVSAKDHTFVYNGEYQSAPENDNVAFDQFELGAGNPYIEAQTKGSIKNVGSTEHTLDSVFIFLSDGTDVTENFNITKNSGTLTVIQRDITVITHSLEKIYDGTPLDTTFAFDVFGLVEGHRVSNWTLTDLIEVGTVDNVIVITEIRNGSENVTPNYNINYEYGTLKIISGKITVETDSAEKVYDGTPLTKNNGSWSGELLSGHSVSLTVIGSITNAGSIENGYSIKITNGDEDVTYMYKVIENLGTLTVTKKDITAYSASDEKTYDGTALTKQQLERVDGLVSGHSVSSVEYSGKQIDVGSSPNYFNVKVIIDAEGNDVTGNYNVIMSEGTLTVTKRAITVSTANAEKIFDGTPLTNGQWNISLGSLVNNQQLTVTVTGSITEVGTAENTFTAEVFANDGTNVSGNYEISADNGILRVISGEILIVTGSDSKTYDATALECLDAYFEGELLSGHTVKIYPVGMQIVPGTSENIFKYEILDENGVVIQSESTPFDEHIYSIAALHGELTVTPIGIEIVTESANKRYDGTPLTHHVYEIIGTVLEGHYVVVNVTGSRTEVGTSDNTFTYQIFDSDGVLIHSSDSTGEFNFYNVLQTFGELTVVSSTKTTVTAQSFDVRKEYDGLPIDNGIVVLNGELASGHRFVYEFVDVSDRILPFKAENKFTCKILDEDGNDVSDEYYVEKIFGELEIEKIKIEITTGSASKFYDGTPLTYEIYTHTGGILLDGHKIIISFTGSQTEVGTSDNTADAYVADADGNRLDEIYDEVSLVFGELTVIKPKVVISPYELQKKYTGEAHVYSNYYSNSWRNVWVSEGKEYLPAGYMIEAEVSGERTKVGETALTVKWVRIYDKDGNDITETFEVVTEESVLTVLKINITISSDSKTKEYDGQSLKAPNHYISVGELFKGHTYTATVDKAVVRPGTYENTIKNVVIIDSATGEDVTDYYEITLDHGTLTITEVDE